jgi:serine O-acetyltransferase
MLNLAKMLKNHFSTEITNAHLNYKLDKDIDLRPEELAIYIYRIQRDIFIRFGEEENKELLNMLSYLMRIYTQMEIYYTADIGENLRIIHGLGTVIGARVIIGDNVELYQNVTLGDKKDGTRERPKIGNNVQIYAGSQVLGGIEIGQNSIIGANSLVLNSFPEYSFIAGSPAKLIRELN